MTAAAVSTQKLYKEIIKFISSYFPLSISIVEDLISKHIEYNTLDIYREHGKIKAIVRYNISESGKIAEVLDMIIDPTAQAKGEKIIKYFVARGWTRFPELEFLRFNRERKYPYRKTRMYRMDKFFKRGDK